MGRGVNNVTARLSEGRTTIGDVAECAALPD